MCDFEHTIKVFVKTYLVNNVAHQHCEETTQKNVKHSKNAITLWRGAFEVIGPHS